MRSHARGPQNAPGGTAFDAALVAALGLLDSGVLACDADGRVVWCNAGFTRLTGHEAKAVIAREPLALLRPTDDARDSGLALKAALDARRGHTGRLAVRTATGAVGWAQVEVRPMAGPAGRPGGTLWLLSDVTASVRAHDDLRVLVDSAAAGIVVQDARGIVVDCNEEAARLVGLERHALLGAGPSGRPSQLCNGDGMPVAWDDHPTMRTLRTGVEGAPEVFRVRRKDGRMHWVQVSCRLLRTSEGAAHAVVSSFIDVSLQQEALAELADERRRLSATLDGTRAGVWEWNLHTNEVRLNARCAELIGLAQADLPSIHLGQWMRCIHPDDKPNLVEHQRRHASGELPYFHADCRLKTRDGAWRWVAVRGRIASHRADGKPEWMYGTHVDIDEAKRSELELQRANNKLKALFEMSPIGIALNDMSDTRFLEFNPAMLAITGYTAEELGRRTHREMCPPACQADVAAQRALLLQTGHYGPYESELIHKHGHHVPVQMAGTFVQLDDGTRRLWSIVQDITPRKRMERQLVQEARTDRLTGLPNRAMLMERLTESVERVRADASRRFALLFIDFDRFKLVNDTLGHDSGDQLLRLIADRLRDALRVGDLIGTAGGSDTGNLISRFGGDEFVVLLRDVDSEEATRRVANRLLDIFAMPYVIRHKELHSSASIGIVLAGEGCESAASVLRNADMAMYEAKRAGRSMLAFFEPGMLTRVTRAVRIEEALRSAIALDQLSVVYQPIVNLETGAVTSAEALLRWNHPELGFVSPAEFIPIAEDSGLIIPIGDWVLRRACLQWASWQAEAPGAAPATVSVNLSRLQMVQGEQLLARVSDVLGEAGMQGHHLQLEVTEREVMRDPAGARRLMNGLRAMGVRLAMDDFGTGASSLGCLREYPFDVIKIDKSFIDDLSGSPDMLAVIHATVSVVENLGMVSVAEGIEEEIQVGILQSLGCRYGQGYYFAKPVPGDRLLGAVTARAACV